MLQDCDFNVKKQFLEPDVYYFREKIFCCQVFTINRISPKKLIRVRWVTLPPEPLYKKYPNYDHILKDRSLAENGQKLSKHIV